MTRDDPRRLFELLAGLAACRRNELPVLEACFDALGMSWDQVLVQYVSKNVLNIFRQDHGYKSGAYVKEWAGQEDNVHLVELVATLDVMDAAFSTDLYNALAARYAERSKTKRVERASMQTSLSSYRPRFDKASL